MQAKLHRGFAVAGVLDLQRLTSTAFVDGFRQWLMHMCGPRIETADQYALPTLSRRKGSLADDEKKTAQYEKNACDETDRNRVSEQEACQQRRQREGERNER